MERWQAAERERRRKWRKRRATEKVLALPAPTNEALTSSAPQNAEIEIMSKQTANTTTADQAAEPPPSSVRVSMIFPPSSVAWLYESGFLPPHVAPSPRAVGEAVVAMMRLVKAVGIRVAPTPAPGPPPPAAEALSPAAADEGLLADGDDGLPAPPATPVNGEEIDPEAEARRQYFERMAVATS